jgi:hypothetical protein
MSQVIKKIDEKKVSKPIHRRLMVLVSPKIKDIIKDIEANN